MSLLWSSFARLAGGRRDELALWSRNEGLRLSFADLVERVERWTEELPLEPGLPVGLATGNGAAFPELFLALRRLDVPVVAIDGGLLHTRKLDLCRCLGVPALLHSDAHGEPLGPFGEGVSLTRLADVEPTSPPPGTALIKLTSGSTGEPVGACLAEEALVAGIRQIGAGMEITGADRVLIAIPLSHSYGFDNGVLSLAVLGTPLVLETRYFPASLLRALDDGRITVFPAVPPLVRTLAECEWPPDLALTRVLSAGGPLHPEFACRFEARSGRAVHQFYGSTETGGICFERAPRDPAAAGTVGHPLPGVEIELGPEGQVTVASPANFMAYLGRDREGSARRVTLGDRAEWTPEGRLRLVGRSCDVLNVGGRKISAAAVEQALRALEGVVDAAVVGVEDPVRGERIVAFVVSALSAIDTSGLAPGLAPREVRLVETLPYTERGKLDRGVLRRLAEAKPS